MEFQNARGTRDISGQDALVRERIIAVLRSVFERYGFNPLQTPILERYETLTSKYAGGEEILKEIFKLKDQGDRQLALRYDLTVPLARFIAQNPTLKMPFKRYAIGSVFRDGPLKLGRYREFTQCDVDVVGNASMTADAEMLQIALAVFEQLELDAVIKVNSRKVLDALLIHAGVTPEQAETAILSIDKLEKFGRSAVSKELAQRGISPQVCEKLLDSLASQGQGDNAQKLKVLKTLLGAHTQLKEIEDVLALANDKRVVFDPSLARGLAYYTGTVFEGFLRDSEIKSSIAGGGRYDRMIGNFVKNGREYPAVGISFGLDVITDALLKSGKSGKLFSSSVVKAYVIAIGGQEQKAVQIAQLLRQSGLNVDADYSGKVGKAIEYANTYAIPYVLFIGKKEVEEKIVKVRDMRTGEEIEVKDGKLGEFFAKGV